MESRSTSVALADRLFVPQERWGWQYVDPGPVMPSPELSQRPVWHEPAGLNLEWFGHRRAAARAVIWPRLKITAIVFFIAIIATAAGGFWGALPTLVLLAGFAWAFSPLVLTRQQSAKAARDAAEHRQALLAQFQAAERDWFARVNNHDAQEQQRRALALLWHPLQMQSPASRVDIIGGTGDGWASLMTTLGASLLQGNARMLVLDFTEQAIADGLARYAGTRGIPVAEAELPTDSAVLNVLGGLEPEDIAELLAESVHTMRPPTEAADSRALDVELLAGVCERLDQPITLTRLVAALKVLRRNYDVTDENGPLTAHECTVLSSYVDDVGTGERVTQQLRFLINVLELVAKTETSTSNGAEPTQVPLWPRTGLTVVETFDSHARRKDVLDRLLFHRLLHELRNRRSVDGRDVVVVAGADHMGLDSIEALAKQARRVGVRLLLVLEQLRGDLQNLLGSSDSASIVMRLGNAAEAAAAAEFIGRGHKFVLSQLTRQVGQTFTEGTAESRGTQDSTARTTGTSTSTTKGSNWCENSNGTSRSRTRSRSESVTESRARTWQETTNQSTADSTTSGETMARVYEFSVEPTTIQALPPTAFVLVETAPSGRRVVMADCNPGITLLDRVATQPSWL